MGGSAAAGDLLALCRPSGATVVREERLPPAAAAGDGFLGLSYSGATGEVLSLWEDAGARGLRRGAVASGGALLDRARKEGAVLCRVPEGLAPRSAIGLLVRAGWTVAPDGPEPDWEKAARHLETVRERWTEGSSPRAEAAASHLAGGLAVIVHGEESAAAARRWGADLAENAKLVSVSWPLPEAAHNRILALLPGTGDPHALRLVVLGISAGREPRRRFEITLALLEEKGARLFRVEEPHPERWIEILGLACAGSWTSLALADRRGVRAEDLSLMDDLKLRLGQGKEAR
jgi:glucose/mannose-6-phosphate isomerase